MHQRWPIAAVFCLFLGVPAPLRADGNGPSAPPDAELLLRKSFTRGGDRPDVAGPAARSHAGGPPGHAKKPGARTAGGGAGDRPTATTSVLAQAAAALGESWSDSGTLYLPEDAGGRAVFDNARYPLVEFGSGRRALLDTDGQGPSSSVAPRWPGYTVLTATAGDDAREALGKFLAAGGYASVMRAAPLTFGKEAVVRLVPDYVVLKAPDAILTGETYLVSVVPSPGDSIPAELREMAREHGLLVVEIVAEGAAAPPPWRDPRGAAKTVYARHPGVLVAELAETLGLTVERRFPCPLSVDSGGAPAAVADLRISRGKSASLVFYRGPDPEAARLLAERGEEVILLWGADAVDDAVVRILDRFGIPRIGPAVEFYQPSPRGAENRFLITVPGWLADLGGGKRLLITRAAIGQQLRLYLTREGIDIFEYSIR